MEARKGSERAFPEQGKGKIKNVGRQARQDRVVTAIVDSWANALSGMKRPVRRPRPGSWVSGPLCGLEEKRVETGTVIPSPTSPRL